MADNTEITSLASSGSAIGMKEAVDMNKQCKQFSTRNNNKIKKKRERRRRKNKIKKVFTEEQKKCLG